jgi:predicted transcriptional regulator
MGHHFGLPKYRNCDQRIFGGYALGVGRPRKPDKKVALSFRASPLLADRLDQFATAMGTSLSEAVEAALSGFFEAGLAREAIVDMEAKRAAAFASIDAEGAARQKLRSVDAETLPMLRAHLHGDTYRRMVEGTNYTSAQARGMVRGARDALGPSYAVLAAKPELLDDLVPWSKRRPRARGTRPHSGS